MTPIEPPRNAIGTNTAESTSPMPTSAPVIWSMDLRVASTGERPSSRISRSTFSTTTIASSTSSPMASTIANMVSMLIEKPSAASTPNVPSSTIGTAIVGISVARKFCRNRYITRNTSTTASTSVVTTPWIDTRTNGVVSNGTMAFMPAGKKGRSSSSASSTATDVCSALAPVASEIAMPLAGCPLKRLMNS